MAANMQAEMVAKTAMVEKEAAERAQKAAKSSQSDSTDPANQLQSLMNTQESLHRLTSVFSGKANNDKVKEISSKLGIIVPKEVMQ